MRACGAGGGGDRVDDGAGVRGLGHEERRHAGLLHGLLQDPGDAQAEQEGALPRQPRRRRRPPRPPQAAAAAAARQGSPAHQARRSGQRPRPAPRPRRLAHGKLARLPFLLRTSRIASLISHRFAAARRLTVKEESHAHNFFSISQKEKANFSPFRFGCS